MNQLWNKLSEILFRNFKLFWVLITLLVFFFCSYLIWHNNIKHATVRVNETVKRIADNFDGFIDSTFALLNNLPAQDRNPDCQKDLIPYLRHLEINSPTISTLILYDPKRNIICSSLPQAKDLLIKNPEFLPMLFGPIHSKAYDHPIYSIQKKIDQYMVTVIVVSPVIENLMQHSVSGVSTVFLYDTHNNKNLYVLNSKIPKPWLYQNFKSLLLPKEPIAAVASLDSVNNISVRTIICPIALFNHLWHQQFLLAIDVIAISLFLYWLIMNVLKKYYSLYWSIKRAIKNKRFYPVYQPLFNTKTKRFSGVEVLIRWQGNEDEVIMPEFFIKYAEESGLIIPMTLQLVNIAFKDTKCFLQRDSQFYLSFNIGAHHFTNPDFFNQFYQLVHDYDISPSQIMLEITERHLLDKNNDVILEIMQELRDKGFSLAVDDYGTGHASISYLYHYPFNYLKIDKLFIHAIGTKAITESLNNVIIDLAKRLDLIIIAEGVETKEQVDFLIENGIQLLQGWYYSKDLSVEQLKKLLQGEKK